jgi:long-subunit fatty acid transport protein
LKLSDGDNPEFDAIAGTEPDDVITLNWKDSISVKLGAEYFFSEAHVLRLGYIYNLGSIPKHNLLPLLPGILEHTFSVGLGHHFGNFDIDYAYQFAFSGELQMGQNQYLGGDFDFSSLRAEAHWFFLTLALKF